MKIGPIARTSYLLDGQPQRFSHIEEQAITAEAVGFDSSWLPDHRVYRPHEPEQKPGSWPLSRGVATQ